MNIALLGYGKMGKEIEKIALERNHLVSLIIDENNPSDLNPKNLKEVDAAIDFSMPSTAFQNIMTCFESDVPVVCGTTGWLDKYETVMETCRKDKRTFFYASNFSIGVNILFALNRSLASMMDQFGDYEVGIREVHHVHKLDAPSGTAISLAKDLISGIRRKEKWALGANTDPDTISIDAVREDEVPGIHEITWESDIDVLTLSHSAKSRKGFALGAVLAAEFIQHKKGCFSMSDMLNIE